MMKTTKAKKKTKKKNSTLKPGSGASSTLRKSIAFLVV